jgi:di/tricarboxylate transporter
MVGYAASFATPIAHGTNTHVFGMGGYRFADFPKIGVPLNVILWIVGSILVPIWWPFVPK